MMYMDAMVECSVCVNQITLFYDYNIIQSKHILVLNIQVNYIFKYMTMRWKRTLSNIHN